jgi:GNAT superfamily N-acetyltransferase
MEIITEKKGDFIISTDKTRLDISIIHDFLANQSYWSRNIPFEKVKTAIDNSLNFGLFQKDKQIGFARVVSDFSTVAYLGDVFVLEEYRGLGLSKWLMEKVMTHPNLQGLRRWILLTSSAHELYKKYGWASLANPGRWMEKHDPDIYNYADKK